MIIRMNNENIYSIPTDKYLIILKTNYFDVCMSNYETIYYIDIINIDYTKEELPIVKHIIDRVPDLTIEEDKDE